MAAVLLQAPMPNRYLQVVLKWCVGRSLKMRLFRSSPSAPLASLRVPRPRLVHSMASNPVIVLAVVAGAGFAVLMGYATARFFLDDDQKDNRTPGQEFEQAQYMREIRLRNHEDIAASLGYNQQQLVRWASRLNVCTCS